MAQATAPTYRRASEFSNGIGSTLEAIEGKDVLLVSYSLTTRRVFDQRQDATVDRAYVAMVIATDIESPEATTTFHAWSPALGERLSEIPSSGLPVIAKFTRVKTANGFSAWVVE